MVENQIEEGLPAFDESVISLFLGVFANCREFGVLMTTIGALDPKLGVPQNQVEELRFTAKVLTRLAKGMYNLSFKREEEFQQAMKKVTGTTDCVDEETLLEQLRNPELPAEVRERLQSVLQLIARCRGPHILQS